MNEVSKFIDRSITTVEFDNNITSIGYYAFYGCSSITSIIIPSGITSIGRNAFDSCTSLTSITCLATTPPTLGSDAFNNTNNCPIYVPSGTLSTYRAAPIWLLFKDRIFEYGVADWRVASSVCETDGSNNNTGYIIVTEQDMNPSSSTYGNTRTDRYEDTTNCPTGGYPIYRKVTSSSELTSGKYLIVNEANNKALDGSLITSVTTSAGLNGANNMVSVSTYPAGPSVYEIEADTQAVRNAAVDYDTNTGYLTWSDGTTTYYIYPMDGSNKFEYTAITTPDTTGDRCKMNFYGSVNDTYLTFGNTSYTAAANKRYLGYNTSGPRINCYKTSNTGYRNVWLYKLVQ